MGPPAKMKARKPSKVVKPKIDKKHSTGHTKNHRFQSFNERIAKLKIDPIRRRRNADTREELYRDTTSYFGQSLEEWRDLNLSKNFTAFAREAGPLCDSLPVVLHNGEKIMDLLVKYIENGDSLSLEPLLDLLSHFAHDLDTRFEKHFPRAVTTITQLASNHSDATVIEWGFTRLAWLFKYLSRVLTPDLRPLYDLMLPYLGKDVRKPFIVRFAAESMSFLIRKAASGYDKDPEPLDLIVSHVLEGCKHDAEDQSNSLHSQGIMTMFSEAVQGVQRDLHSNGLSVLKSILHQTQTLPLDGLTGRNEVLAGLTTCLIHHTDVDTFRPVFDIIIAYLNDCVTSTQTGTVQIASHLMFVMITVRKGSRISHWTQIMTTLQQLIQYGVEKYMDPSTRQSVLSAVAAAFQTATVDAILPNLRILRSTTTGEWKPFFPRFCDLFSRLGRERFQQFLLPEFQTFILDEWKNSASTIIFYLPKFAPFDRKVILPEAFQMSLLEQVSSLEDSMAVETLPQRLVNASLALNTLRQVSMSEHASQKLGNILLNSIRSVLESPQAVSDLGNFALGPCFATLLEVLQDSAGFYNLLPLLCRESSRFVHSFLFWSNLLRYINSYQQKQVTAELTGVASLETSLLRALSLPSHGIRQAALDVALSIYKLRNLPVPECLLTAIAVESTPIGLDTSRSISLNLRRLIASTLDEKEDAFIQRAISSYCFGVLHLRLAQAWEDAIDTLAHLSKNSVCEEAIISLVQIWLEMTSEERGLETFENFDAILDSTSTGFHVGSEFECPNLAKLTAISQEAFSSGGGHPSAAIEFHKTIELVPSVAHNGREQALRVLNKIPSLAEKKSRMLVPVLLQWGLSKDTNLDPESRTQRWSRKDQKALLSVFAQFTNPKVLFKSADVYEALLNLCTNGDVEIQRSALKAIYAWKDPAVNSYEEHLNNLLDEARFRDEVSVFLQGGYEDAVIRVEHEDMLMPVLLRLLYGRAVSGGKQGQSSRRKAIFVAVSRYGMKVLQMFVEVVLGRTAQVHLTQNQNNTMDEIAYSQIDISLRQQYGMLNMVNDLLETLGSTLEPFAEMILASVLICSIAASRKLDAAAKGEDKTSLLRSIRQAGLQCIVRLFALVADSAFPVHAHTILDELFVPRQAKFASENTQSVSAMLRLLSVFASSPQSGPYLSKHSEIVLEKIAELLREPSAKEEVQMFILQEILDCLLANGAVSILTQEHVTIFVRSIGEVLKQQPSKAVIDACVASLTNLASWIEEDQDALQLVGVCTELLTKPQKLVSPSTKAGLLKVLSPILDLISPSTGPALYDAMCGLFSRLHDLETRMLLSVVFSKVCRPDSALMKSSRICEDLNSQGSRLDEPDHERKERGFNNTFTQAKTFTMHQWQPILQNCLFYVRDDADIVNRTSSSQALARFIESASINNELKPLVLDVILPGIERGIKLESELVRAEFVQLLGHLVEGIPDLPATRDLKGLTVRSDDEASVFSNVLHIQQHRRLRALRRLSDESSNISSANATKIFVPLLEHFIFDWAEGDVGRTLADQAILTIGALGKSLSWTSFRATFKRYVGYLSSKPEQEAVIMRLLSALVDGITLSKDAMDVADTSSKKQGDIKRDLLPPLLDYIHLKDESTVDRRMPVAVTIVKLLLLLPKEELNARLAPVLTDVCQILRSHSQEARDQTRKTLAATLALVGPAYLGFILKELRGALKRGSQLHVLSFTVHSLLVSAAESYKPGDLDYCLPELAAIIMDDTFGVTGEEKDSEDYRSKLKEVKSSKSFDTMELLARVTPMQKLAQLVHPLRAFLSESIDSKALKKADDLLARLRNGVEQNPAAQTRDALIFCHELIRQVQVDQQKKTQNTPAKRVKYDWYIIQPEASQKPKRKETVFIHSFRLVGFALNLLRKVLRRHDDLMTAANLAGFLPLIGDALVQGQEEIQISAIKILSTIMKVGLPELDRDAPVYVNEAVRIIKSSTNFTGEGPRAALDLLTSILREKGSVEINERDIGTVLKALQTEIDEPDKQGSVYKFLRTVLNRNIMITEVYEVMDNVGRVSVVNADRGVRESARSAYVQFIVEYPHGKDRWNKQAMFLVENLKYEHASGRQSVMELLNQLLPKLPDEVIEQLALTLFIALVPVQSSDMETTCRQMAGILLGKLFERVDSTQMNAFLSLLERWAAKRDSPTITAAAFQCWSVAMQKISLDGSTLAKIQSSITGVLREDETEPVEGRRLLMRSALETLQVLISTSPDTAFAGRSSKMWQSAQRHLNTEDIAIQEAIAKLMEDYFSHLASSSSKLGSGLSSLPLKGAFGLELDASYMRQICQSSIQVLLSEVNDLTETLASWNVRNIVFLGRCFSANRMHWADADEGPLEEPDENVAESDLSLSAVQYLFNQLSYITRQENLPVLSRMAAIQSQIALIKHVDEIPDVVALVKPLYLVTDPSVPKPNDEAYKTLTDLARELLDAIQDKSGAESYVSALGEARNYAKSRREDRRQKRKIAAVSAPEKWANAKKRKHEAQRAKTKSNALVARGKRRGW